MSQQELIENIYGDDEQSSNAVEVLVGRLRRKIGGEWIEMRRGFGYLIPESTARARGRAADLAHGLKTPLAALAGDVRRLRDGGQTEIACSIEASGETMRRHVERELARARMHRGHPVLAADSTSVSEVVDALFGILKRTDKGASLALVNDAPRSVRAPMERADLTEALGNVLDNAVRYAKTTVRVSCQGDSEPLAIVVEDDGPGIEQTLEAIIRQRGGRLDERGAPRPVPRAGHSGRLSLADGLRILRAGRCEPAAREGAIVVLAAFYGYPAPLQHGPVSPI